MVTEYGDAGVPLPPDPHAAAAAMWLPLASISTHRPEVCVPVVVTNAVVLPDRVPTVGATPAPPPITGRFAVSAAEEAIVDEAE